MLKPLQPWMDFPNPPLKICLLLSDLELRPLHLAAALPYQMLLVPDTYSPHMLCQLVIVSRCLDINARSHCNYALSRLLSD